jgi:hypothetical protein
MENPSNIRSPCNLPKSVVKSEYPSGQTRKADTIKMELPELKKSKIEDSEWGATEKFLTPWYDRYPKSNLNKRHNDLPYYLVRTFITAVIIRFYPIIEGHFKLSSLFLASLSLLLSGKLNPTPKINIRAQLLH